MSEIKSVGGSREPKTNKQLAQEAGVSVSTIKRAKKAARLAPEKVDAIIRGEITATQVIREAEAKIGMKKYSPPEKEFQAKVISLAKQLGWLYYHTHDSRRSEPGFPDLILVRERVLYRELKTEKGRLTKAQKAWGDKLTAAGADSAVWRPSDMQEIVKQLSH